MVVDPGAQPPDRVVQVHEPQSAWAEVLVHRAEHPPEPLGGPEVEARREGVARVEADANLFGTADAVDDRPELLETRADAVPGSGAVLEDDRDPRLVPVEDPVERPDHSLDPLFRAGAQVAADVGHQHVDPEGGAPPEPDGEGLDGSEVHLVLGRGEVQDVGHVPEHRLDPREPPLLPEGGHLGLLQGPVSPAAGVPGEDLEGVAAQLLCALHGLVDAPRDGDVEAEPHHRFYPIPHSTSIPR